MGINVTHYEPHTSSLRPFKFFSNSFIDFYSCKVISSNYMRKNKASGFASIMAVDMKL